MWVRRIELIAVAALRLIRTVKLARLVRSPQCYAIAQRRVSARDDSTMKGCGVRFIRLACLLATAHGLTASAAELPRAPEGSFSIVVIPDTQHYRGQGTKAEPESQSPVSNPTFRSYVDWIVANLDRQRIVFVSHVGDVVDVNHDAQWSVARQCMDRLHGKVPYGISVGNHDMTSAGDSTLFQYYFSRDRFSDFPWYGGCYRPSADGTATSGNNANSFQLFSAAGMDFVVFHLECNAPDDVLSWVDGVMNQHADRHALVTTHMGLGPHERPRTAQDYFDAPKGRMIWTKCHSERGNSPQQMWDKCFRKHGNLLMICCGDQSRTQAYRQESRGENGNTVHELLSDYGTNGLRLMTFHPRDNRIEVRTWNPMKGQLCESTSIIPDRSQHQFELSFRMTEPNH